MTDSNRRLIELAPTAVTHEEAIAILRDVFAGLGLPSPGPLPAAVSLKALTGETADVPVNELIAEIERLGVSERLHDHLSRQRVSRPLSISTTVSAPGFKIAVRTTPGTEVEVAGAGYVRTNVVADALEDVLFYRHRVAALSDGLDMFRPCFRAFKAYLSASITAIDATLNGYAFYWRQMPGHSAPAIKELSRKHASLYDKLTKWVPILSSGSRLSESSQYWKDYDELRNARNAFTHVNSPTYRFSVSEAARHLNLCRHGVGGLLLAVGQALGSRFHSSWVLRVARAPIASLTDSRARTTGPV